MRRIGALLLGLAILGTTGLWFAPRLIDEATVRDRLAGIATSRLGRPVALEGPIALQLLPEPRLEATRIAIGGVDTGPEASPAATARGLRLTLGAGALLRGRLEPRELVIVGAELRLPWPPHSLQELRPPAWLTAFEARLEDSRVLLGELAFEAVELRLASQGANAALTADGRFAWRGGPVRFAGRLGRSGADGAAPLDLRLNAGTAQLSMAGIVQADGGFEGDVAAVGSDASGLLPVPQGSFELRGRLHAEAALLALDPLHLRLDKQSARGAASLRLAPELGLELALTAGQADLDAWLGTLRGRPGPPFPVSLDLDVAAAPLHGVSLRRLRTALRLEAARMTVSEATAELDGGTRIAASGTGDGRRLELAVQFASDDPRQLLARLGLTPPADPALLQRASGRARLALQEDEATLADLDMAVDAVRMTGGGSWRRAPKPTIGLGLTLDRLALDRWIEALPTGPVSLAGTDVNLRLSVERASLGSLDLERAMIDAGLEAGRLTLRRLAFRLAELDVSAATVVELGAERPVLADLVVEASGRPGQPALLESLPAALRPWLDPSTPLVMRAQGGGPWGALALVFEAEHGPLRFEANGTVDPSGRRAVGTATLRHPGAPRLLAPWLGPEAATWLGEGSLAVIGNVAVSPAGVVAEHLDLVAGGLRAQGRLALERNERAPSRLLGALRAERLPLPPAHALLAQGPPELEADIAVTAEQVTMPSLPLLTGVGATLRTQPGRLTVQIARGKILGGTLEGEVASILGASGPEWTLRTNVADATLTGGAGEGGLDLSAGRLSVTVDLAARGASASSWLTTLAGTARLSARDGVLAGADFARASAIADAAPVAAPGAALEAGLRQALGGGATGFDRLGATARVTAGQAVLEGALDLAEGGAVNLRGSIDLPRGVIDLRFALPAGEGAPSIGLRALGPWAAPRRVPELAPFLRWRAEQG